MCDITLFATALDSTTPSAAYALRIGGAKLKK